MDPVVARRGRPARWPARGRGPSVRAALALEAAAFAAAALVHAGRLVRGFAHPSARTAEAVISAVLAGALLLTYVRPAGARWVGAAAQAFALLGTLVGLTTIAVGVGPRTAPDVVFHVAIAGVLVAGLVASPPAPRPTPA